MLLAACVLSVSIACANGAGTVKVPGKFQSASGQCVAVTSPSKLGGFLQLSIKPQASPARFVADDITGFAWFGTESFIFSTSPIYGSPGVFLASCGGTLRIKTLVAPKTIDAAYPKGADYFELRAIRGNRIEFYYGADVDKIDFNEFRTNKYLRSVKVSLTEATLK